GARTPVLTTTAAGDQTVQATSVAGAAVTWSISATDPDDAAGAVTCSPDSGSTFAVGTTPVHCSSTDTHSNTGVLDFNVVVTEQPPVDTTPPALTKTPSGDQTGPASSPAGGGGRAAVRGDGADTAGAA